MYYDLSLMYTSDKKKLSNIIFKNIKNFKHLQDPAYFLFSTVYRCNNIVGNLMIGILFRFSGTQNIDLF